MAVYGIDPYCNRTVFFFSFKPLRYGSRHTDAVKPCTALRLCRVKSRHICTDLRSSLKENTIKMALLTKVWIHSGLFEMMPKKILWRKHGDNGQKKKSSRNRIYTV